MRRAQGKTETRKVLVPPHRYTPLKESWELIYEPLVEQMGLQVRMNVKKRTVELRVRVRSVRLLSMAAALSATDWLSAVAQTSSHTVEAGALVKGADFVKAFVLGFEVQVGFCRTCSAYALVRELALTIPCCCCGDWHRTAWQSCGWTTCT